MPITVRHITIGAAIALVATAAAPVLASPITRNVGWQSDILFQAGPTDGSPFTFTLAAGETASFKVTDQFAVGDSFFLFDDLVLLASSSAFAGTANAIVGDSFGEAGWLNPNYEKFEYSFSGVGSYSFRVDGDGAGGVPAGLYVRLDVTSAVPEPASLALAALALLGAGAVGRRRS